MKSGYYKLLIKEHSNWTVGYYIEFYNEWHIMSGQILKTEDLAQIGDYIDLP